MSYCRFSDADAYLYYSTDDKFECCSCSLAPLVRTVLTGGTRWREAKNNPEVNMFEECPYCDGESCEKCWCPDCKGEGCNSCMLHGNTTMDTAEEALEHLLRHKKAGHNIPDYAIERLKEEIEDIDTM